MVSWSGDKTGKVWGARSGQEQRTLTGHTKRVSSVAYSSGGRGSVSGSGDKTVKVWGARSGQEQRTLTGHTKRVSSVAYSTGGRGSVSGAYEVVEIWGKED
ncbi:MAG: hypothetical protein LBK00_07515 [Treponema sp.]|nr:hypothetical protein [Treponema sp.]